MSDLFAKHPISIGEMKAELQREIGLRKRVYPRWVELGKVNAADAERRIAILESAVVALASMESALRFYVISFESNTLALMSDNGERAREALGESK